MRLPQSGPRTGRRPAPVVVVSSGHTPGVGNRAALPPHRTRRWI